VRRIVQKEIREGIRLYLQNAAPGRILDIPSGSCWLHGELNDPAWDYYAADLYSEDNAVQLEKADLNSTLPYADGFFDYVACLEGLEHAENYHHVLREFARILKPGGKLLISTPNPLNVKSRIRYLLWGTFYGFPHLANMPAEGEHLHMSPVNLSFLISFAEHYGLRIEQVHSLAIPLSMYRFVIHAAAIRALVKLKLLAKDSKTRTSVLRLHDWNVLLNNGLLVSFTNCHI
jgi:SAM-dependent methyltransferase